MFYVENTINKITMHEGDFGLILPIQFPKAADGDIIKFTIKKQNEENEQILDLDFEVTSEMIDFTLSQNDSSKLEIGEYLYDVKQYREGVLENTIATDCIYEVVRGA